MPDSVTDDLLARIAMKESKNNPSAIGDKGLKYPAYGAYQMREPAFQDVKQRRPNVTAGINRLQDIVGNAEQQKALAAAYLDILMHDYKLPLEQAVQAYNAGPTAVRRGRVPAASVQYMKEVLGK